MIEIWKYQQWSKKDHVNLDNKWFFCGDTIYTLA